jgi:hypothetical protein
MKLIDARLHGALDYVAVAVFALAPFLFRLEGTPALICWGLAIVHLLLTILTKFPAGIIRVIPFVSHGAPEIVVSVGLVFSPWMFGYAPGSPARRFFVAAGAALFLLWLLTDYAGRGLDRAK